MASTAAAARSRKNKLRIGPLLPGTYYKIAGKAEEKILECGSLAPAFTAPTLTAARSHGNDFALLAVVHSMRYTSKAAARPPHSKKITGVVPLRSRRGFPACRS